MSALLNERSISLDLLQVSVSEKPSGTTIFTLRGDVDISNAGDVREIILRETNNGQCDIICNLSALDFIDSTGLRTLINIQTSAVKHGRKMHVQVGANHRIKRLLDISGLDRVFTLVA